MKLKKGDNILVLSGKDKGRKGKVLEVFPKKELVIIEGINLHKKHKKPRRQGQKGEVMEVASPIYAAKVKIVCPKCSKPARIGYKLSPGGKYRACKKCGEAV